MRIRPGLGTAARAAPGTAPGSVGGTLVGGLIVGILTNILNLTNVSPYWQQILKGVIILIAVIMDTQTKALRVGKSK